MIEVEVSCPDYGFEQQASGNYRLTSTALPSTTEGGAPDLPGRLLRIALPMDTDLDSVSLQVAYGASTALAGSFALTPALVAATSTEDGEVLLASNATLDAEGRNVDLYATNGYYDSEWCTLISTQQMGRWKIAEVYYSPFAYNPVTGEVQVVEAGGFSLQYSGGNSPSATLAANTAWDVDAEELVINAGQAAEWYTSTDSAAKATVGYAIITTTAIARYSAQLDDFVAAKEAAGYTVTVATESDWGGGTGDAAAENIRSWLQENYASLTLEYVLLIGDPTPTTGSVPMKMMYPRSGETDYRESPSDYYYADLTSDWDLDGDGLYGEWGGDISTQPLHEVTVGRMSVYGTAYSTLDSILAKTIAYGKETDISWRENVLLPMAVSNYENEDDGGATRVDGVSLAECVASDLADPKGYGTYRLYEKAGLAPVTTSCDVALTEDNLLNAWTTNAYGLVDWWGHGSSSGAYRKYWASDDNGDAVPDSSEMEWTPFMTSDDAAALDDSHPSVVFQVSCNNGYPEVSSNLGYSLLKNGAIATYSASRVSWYAVTTWAPWLGIGYGDNASYAYYGSRQLVEKAETATTGSALQWCRENLGTGFGAESWMNCLDFNLLGDPSLTPLYVVKNSAPVLDNSGAMSLTPINEDVVVNTGTLVSAIIASAGGDRITDSNPGAVEGIAVTAVVNTNGTWQYSTNSGLTWTSFGSPSTGAARLLASDSTTRIRFVPNANWNGTLTGITFRAWDQTSGTNGGTADTSNNGGETAFSTATETASLTVTAVNDAPAGSNATLSTLEDERYLFSAEDFGFTDAADGDALAAVKIASLPGAGTLELDGEAVAVGDSVTAAELALGLLSYQPAADGYGAAYAEFTFQVQDDGGTANGGVDLDPTANTITFDVTAVNDAPTAVALDGAIVTNLQASGSLVGRFSTTDPDVGDIFFIYTLLDNAGGLFRIEGDQLVVADASLLEDESVTSYTIVVQTTDAGGLSFAQELTIDVFAIDGVDSVAVFDPRTSTFYLLDENVTGSADYTFAYGAAGAGWESLVGDWDGNGTSGVGLYDESASTFYLTSAYVSGVAEYTFGYGVPGGGWIPLVGDWDGNGTAGVGLYDPATSMFYLTDTLATGMAEYTFGYGVPNGGWEPIVGDWDGNGTTGVGLYDPRTSTFYLTNALATGMAEYTFGYGVPDGGWQPLVGDWNGNGATGVGLYDPAASTFYLTDTLATGYAETTFGYGVPDGGWQPLVGDWNGDGASGVGLYDPQGTMFYLSNALATGTAEHMVQIGEATEGCVPLVGCWTEVPPAAAVDAVDLADLASETLGNPLRSSLDNADAIDRVLTAL